VSFIAGIDEVGRGPLCGPVVASAVIFPKNTKIDGVNDSKKLSAKKRDLLFDIIKQNALSIGIGVVHEDKIDEVNILEATMIAMREAVEDLNITPDLILVDGNMKDITDIPQKNIIKGDSKSFSIAAASIIAKVTRDRMMIQYDKIFPEYGLANNMGYGTKQHMSAISLHFSTPIHRQSFRPISDYMPTYKNIRDIITNRSK
jgi:ribonuclease HII